MKILTPILLACLGLCSSRLAAAPWSMDASLLAFNEGKAIGASAGWGYRWPHVYLGGDLLVHNFSDSTNIGGISAKASSKLFVPGLLFKFFVPLTGELDLFGGAGLGYGAMRTDYTATAVGVTGSLSSTSDDIAGQLVAGLQRRLGPTGALKLGWRYLKVEDPSFLGDSKFTVDRHAVELGISFEF